MSQVISAFGSKDQEFKVIISYSQFEASLNYKRSSLQQNNRGEEEDRCPGEGVGFILGEGSYRCLERCLKGGSIHGGLALGARRKKPDRRSEFHLVHQCPSGQACRGEQVGKAACTPPLAGPLSIATTKEAETEAPPVQGYSRRCGKWQRKGFNRLIKETRCPRKCASKECDHPLAQKLPLELASSTQPGPSKLVGSAVTH